MRRSAGGSHIPARATADLSTKTLIPSPDFGLPWNRKPQTRRRIRSPAFFPASPVARARKHGRASIGRRRSGPSTPLLRWKFDEDDDDDQSGKTLPECRDKERRTRQNAGGEEAPSFSARKIAAGIWHLQIPEVGGVGGEGSRSRLDLEPNPGHLHIPYVCAYNNSDFLTGTKNEFSRSMEVHNHKDSILHKIDASAALPNSAMERATKWDSRCSKVSDDLYRIYGHLKHIEDKGRTVSVDSTLQVKLELARTRISELEAERLSAKKKLDHFLRKLAEEKASWQSREHDKIRSVIDAMRDDLKRERKIRKQMEIVNSKLVNELTEAKLSAKQFLQDYEKERTNRELMEEVCDEMAKEIGEDKAEVEELKRESMKIQEELEEERRMLQMAEVWREERVQMKLIDAKLTLEEKYSQLSNLQADIEAFLTTRSGTNPDVPGIKEAKLLSEAASSVKVQEINEFSYQPPPASEDIFSVFDELQPREETNERETEQGYGYSPATRASRIQTSSPDINGFLEKPTKRCASERNRHIDYESSWETVSHGEEVGSSNSTDGSEPSVNRICDESIASVSGTDWEENGKLNSEIAEAYSSTTKQFRKKASSIARLWRSSSPNNDGETYKKHAVVEAANGRLSNGRISNATALSPARMSGEVGLSSPSVGQWSSPDSLNPHITRGMKGCIEWPKGTQKQSLKGKLLEARMESQKIQLRHVLKQKI